MNRGGARGLQLGCRFRFEWQLALSGHCRDLKLWESFSAAPPGRRRPLWLQRDNILWHQCLLLEGKLTR